MPHHLSNKSGHPPQHIQIPNKQVYQIRISINFDKVTATQNQFHIIYLFHLSISYNDFFFTCVTTQKKK